MYSYKTKSNNNNNTDFKKCVLILCIDDKT